MTCAPELISGLFNLKLLILHVWWGCRKQRVKFKTKRKKRLIDCGTNKKYIHSCDLILSFLKVVFWENSELSWIGVVWLNLSNWKSFKCFSSLKIHFREPTQFPSFFLATRSWQKTTIYTSEPYTRAMRGTMHEPQANLRADQKFSSGRLKTRKDGLSKN